MVRIGLRKFWLFLSFTLLIVGTIAIVAGIPQLQDVAAEEPDPLQQAPSVSSRAAPSSLRQSPTSPAEIESITSSSVTTADCYQPNIAPTPQVLCFTVRNSSTDGEWLNRVRLTFPNYAGLGPWIVSCDTQDLHDSNGLTVNMTCSASSNEVVYEDNDNASDLGIGEISSGASWGFCVNVTVPTGYNGPRYVQWGLRGDGTGATPHEVYGSTEIQMCTPLMLTPDSVTGQGCNGVPSGYVFELWNNTGSPGTFDLSYNVSSGNGVLSGPTSFSLTADETLTFTAQLEPDLCLGPGDKVLATVQVAGSGTSDTSSIVHTISDFGGWEKREGSPVTTMDSAVAWASIDGGLWSVGGYGSQGATQRYDPGSDSWTLHTPESTITPTIRYPADGCYGLDADGHEVIVLFPDTESAVNTLHRYDITDDQWDEPAIPAGFPPEGRWAMDITSLYNITGDNICYLSGGATQSGGGNVNNLWSYNPATNITIYLGNFAHHSAGFDFHASWYVPWIGDAGAICVGGGTDAQSNVIADTQCYDLATGTYRTPNTDLGPLPEPWWGMADGWKMHNGRYQIWIANGVAQDGSLIGATAYADEFTGGFVYGPPPLTNLYRLEGDNWLGHFYTEQGSSGSFTHTSNQETLLQCPACLQWDKQINGEAWIPDLALTTEVSDTIAVVDVFTTNQPIDLLEEWDPNRLDLVGWMTEPSVGSIVTGTGSALWSVPPGGFQVLTMTKWFHVEPCTWTDTELVESLGSQGQELETRAVPIQKLPPELWIESHYDPSAYAGEPAFFTLEYGNAGAYENRVTIENTFPLEAPFAWANPWPDQVDPDGLWAQWRLGDLARNSTGVILVEVDLNQELEPGNPVQIWDGIYDHAGGLKDETWIEFLIAPPPGVYWEKTINEVPWYPDISLSVETFGLVTVVDRIEASPEFDVKVAEEWDPELLVLEDVEWTAGALLETPPGQLVWHLPTDSPPGVISKTFRVQDCTWELVELLETLLVDDTPQEIRPVTIIKDQPSLWIDSAYEESVVAGKVTTYTLLYGNEGGYESSASIYGEFLPEAIFDDSVPPPTELNEEERWARWELGELPRGAEGSIEVGVLIQPGVPISTPLTIPDVILGHGGIVYDEVFTHLHVVPPPPPEWVKWVNGERWHPELVVTEETSGTIEIVDVFYAEHAFNIYEEWDPGKLALASEVVIEPEFGELHVNPDEGWVEWTVPPPDGPTEFTITKRFHVEPCLWEGTFVRELLSVADEIVEERGVFIIKDLPRLWIDSSYEPIAQTGLPFTYTLDYGNLGGFESEAMIAAEFPAQAPFRSSEPAPFYVSPDGLSVRWNTGTLERDEVGDIQVSIDIASTAAPLSTISVWGGIINHGGELEDEVWSHFLVGARIYLPLILRD